VGDVAVVTGGGSGIGVALGRALVRRGCDVVLADLDAPAAVAAADRLTAEGPGTAVAAPLDVADAAAVQDLIEATAARHGRLDWLFNNAGIGLGGEPEELTLAHWERCIDVNLRGVLHGCHAVLRLSPRLGDALGKRVTRTWRELAAERASETRT
jgi:NAD(P)-dependent dehydrogenase (short-subunit alcohol dehydrogenase family)